MTHYLTYKDFENDDLQTLIFGVDIINISLIIFFCDDNNMKMFTVL